MPDTNQLATRETLPRMMRTVAHEMARQGEMRTGVSMVDYLAMQRLSSGVCATIANQSPLHGWADSWLNPERENEPNNAVSIGTVAHSLILENDESGVVVVDASDWRTKAAKEAREAAETEGKTALLPDQWERVQQMRDAALLYIRETDLAGPFKTGKPEITMLWDTDGIECKARPDLITPDGRWLVHLKTTPGSANPAMWSARQFFSMGYDIAAAFYEMGAKACGAESIQQRFLVQEQSFPFACCLIRPSTASLEVGAAKVARGMKAWKRGMETGNWPGFSYDVYDAEPTPWEYAKMEEASNG